jgi:phosphoribosyl 1,2-cyclic phosphate phosphodiesterase
MKLTILGSGTSTGVPVIGCGCDICSSTEPGNNRTRTSALVEVDGINILIDTSTDLRTQCLANDITRIDAVLFTHQHADHIHGIDDLRAFNLLREGTIPCFGNGETLKRIRTIFSYIFSKDRFEGWKPDVSLSLVNAPFDIEGVRVTPLAVEHGKSSVLGYRIKDAAYITDVSAIPSSTRALLEGLDVLVLGALRQKPHPAHFSIEEAVEVSRKINPKRTILTHLSHNVDFVKDGAGLPEGVELACDGMVIDI